MRVVVVVTQIGVVMWVGVVVSVVWVVVVVSVVWVGVVVMLVGESSSSGDADRCSDVGGFDGVGGCCSVCGWVWW